MQRMLQRIRVGLVPRVFGVAIAGVLLVIGILGWTTLSYIERDIDENARKQLDMAINLELALIDEHLERVKAQAATLAANPKLAADLLEGDFAAVAQDLRRFKQAAETDILTVVDASGRVVARANGSSSGQILSVNGLVPLALQGTAIASPEILPRSEWEPEGEEIRRRVVLPIVPTEGAETRRETELTDALALVAAAPVRSPSGQVIGAVVAAEVLNQNFSIVDEVRERTGGLVSATIALDGVRVTTNVRSRDARGNPTGERALGTIYSIPVMESLRAGMEYRGRALVVGEWQKTIYVPLKDHTGRVIAGPYVGIPESTFSTLRERFLSTLGPVAGISVMLLIGAALFLGRILDRVFERLLEAAERASRGDLTPIDLGVRRNDEVGELARAFEGMTNGIRDLLRSLMRAIHDLLQAVGLAGQVSKRLGESSKRVSASIARVAKGAQDQSQSVADTMSIIAEVRKAIEQIAEGAHQQSQDVYRTSRIFAEAAKAISQVAQEAQEVSAAASQTLASARTGGMAVQKSLDAMTRISSSSAEVAESIRELGRRSQQIAEIVQLIREIADQTNLLALNAAIEAARAGQHGKGFAVVAGEVRNLAVRAGQATQEIAALVSAIQGGVERSAQAVEAGMRDVKEGAVLGEEARRALEEILSAMERTNEKAQAIAALAGNVETSAREAVEAMDHVAAVTETNSAATSEMAASSEQMSEAMTRIAAISEENALAAKEVSASMEEMNAIAAEIASSAQSLARIAQQLQEQAVRFKI